MATLVGQAKKAHARRGSLSVVKPREERLDKTQGLHESDYNLQGKDVPMDVVAPSAVPLDVFDYTQLEEVRPWPKPSHPYTWRQPCILLRHFYLYLVRCRKFFKPGMRPFWFCTYMHVIELRYRDVRGIHMPVCPGMYYLTHYLLCHVQRIDIRTFHHLIHRQSGTSVTHTP